MRAMKQKTMPSGTKEITTAQASLHIQRLKVNILKIQQVIGALLHRETQTERHF